jgi:hypothetical protein
VKVVPRKEECHVKVDCTSTTMGIGNEVSLLPLDYMLLHFQ